MKPTFTLLTALLLAPTAALAQMPQSGPVALRVVSRIVSPQRSAWSHAHYTEPTGVRLARAGSVSEDNGKTWKPFLPKPDYSTGLPYGYRRDQGTSIIDPKNGRFVLMVDALDTPGLDPKAIEPTIAQFDDGRILMVMRGSNAKKPELPGYKWFSISKDDGETWSAPEPWRYDDGANFFSPSSMSTLMRHSSGRVFWVGNISPTNGSGNAPRLPLMMGEVDPKSLMLIRSSVIELDTRKPEDEARGLELTGKPNAKLDLSHFWVIEDRETKEVVISYPRSYGGYVNSDWAMLRVALK